MGTWAASTSVIFTFFGFSVMSLTVAARPTPSFRVMMPWAASRFKARASLVGSLGTTMVAPSAREAKSFAFPG